MNNRLNHSSTFNFNVKALKDGAPEGYCRICGKYASLTDDHVPPKSCDNKGRTKFSISEAKTFIMQNGFHCRTICQNCNNELLGCDLDKEYKRVYEQINLFKKSGLYLPGNILEIDVDVKKFFRCILAHFFSVVVYDKELSIKEVLEKPIQNFMHKNFLNHFIEDCPLNDFSENENVAVLQSSQMLRCYFLFP